MDLRVRSFAPGVGSRVGKRRGGLGFAQRILVEQGALTTLGTQRSGESRRGVVMLHDTVRCNTWQGTAQAIYTMLVTNTVPSSIAEGSIKREQNSPSAPVLFPS